jgi:hypothetical protein
MMADWKKLLKQVLLADGIIDSEETTLLRQEILADGVIDEREKKFLKEIKVEAKQISPEFSALCKECLGE